VKVRELIEALQECDPELGVEIPAGCDCGEHYDDITNVSVKRYVSRYGERNSYDFVALD